jgi:hypothetical protein
MDAATHPLALSLDLLSASMHTRYLVCMSHALLLLIAVYCSMCDQTGQSACLAAFAAFSPSTTAAGARSHCTTPLPSPVRWM